MPDLVVAEQEVLEPGQRTLGELAAAANSEHGLAMDAALASVAHAIQAGDALLAAREQVPRGSWEAWLEENFSAPSMSGPYMRLAFHKAIIPSDTQQVREALAYLRGLPGIDGSGPQCHPPELRAETLRLHDQGLNQHEIASLLGVARSSVGRWIRGTGREAHRTGRPTRGSRERRAREHAAREALRAQERNREIKRAVRKAGAATAEAWAMAERLQDVLGQAHRETEDREAREALSRAGEHYRKMRDEIVRALGVS